jgi:SAM-dependent methyltransferase
MLSAYDFGYSWMIGYGAVIPLAVALLVGAVAIRRRWRRWVVALAGVAALWAIAALVVVNVVWGLNRPSIVPNDFLSSGEGRVLDMGAGSGRAAIGVLLSRPRAHVTGLDIYSGYWGIEDNTPDRFMRNAGIAGAANRADARIGDMRELPFAERTFDAIVSSYAIDHLNRDGRAKALAEAARVLKSRGELLLMVVNVDAWTWLVNPVIALHPPVVVDRWHGELDRAGFEIEREGTQPLTRYWLARKRSR